VERVDDSVRTLWDDMCETMYAMPGVGLAAPQIGAMLRVAVVDCGLDRAPIRLANPKVLARSEDHYAHEEASPCLPGVSARLERPRRVTVRFLDETGAQVERSFEELWSTSVLHQIDHLDGLLFVHRLSRLKRQRLIEKSRKKGNRA
jgi:peptide deformylase